MSKKVIRNTGSKRKAKTNKRKGLVLNHSKKKGTIEERIIKKVKHQIKTNTCIETEQLSVKKITTQCEEKIKELLIFHYYLIFIKEMIDGGVLIKYELEYDVVHKSKLIRNLNESIKKIPYLDEDISYVEAARIAECIEELALDIHDEIIKTNSIEKLVASLITKRSKFLPPKSNNLPYSNQEAFNKVLTITAINYMATKVFNIPQVKKGFIEEIEDNEPRRG